MPRPPNIDRIAGEGDVASTIPSAFTSSCATAIRNLTKPRLPLSVTVGGMPAFLQFCRIAPELLDTAQADFIVPRSVATGVQPVVVAVGPVATAPVSLIVTAP